MFVYKVRTSDQTTFSCQVTIQTFRLLQPARVKTLTSSTVFLTIYSPPERLFLRRIPLPVTSKHLQDGNINLQSDNPSLADVHTFQSFEKPLSLPRPSTHRLQHSTALTTPMEVNIQQKEEIWALEGHKIAIECIASPSSPASKLMWILSPVAEVEEDLSLQPTFDFEDFSKKSRSLQFERKYPKWRFVFDAREGAGLGFRVENKEVADSTTGLEEGERGGEEEEEEEEEEGEIKIFDDDSLRNFFLYFENTTAVKRSKTSKLEGEFKAFTMVGITLDGVED
ncbi:unnamed protein product [Hydatigera taeniaeformis]|uniref:Uncharacterized protein n=1 Tax=Hydatigena taeniaeformis TaxID=6205 RepID=A0A3P7EEY2_HYDTA|nr:unnamed protein product [Hydatigera taeniaeformis]